MFGRSGETIRRQHSQLRSDAHLKSRSPLVRARPESIANSITPAVPPRVAVRPWAVLPSRAKRRPDVTPNGRTRRCQSYALDGNRGNSIRQRGEPTGFPTGGPLQSNGNNPAPTTSFAANPTSASGPGESLQTASRSLRAARRSAPAVATSSGSPEAPNQARLSRDDFPARRRIRESKILRRRHHPPPQRCHQRVSTRTKTPPASGNGSALAVAAQSERRGESIRETCV